MKFTYYFQILIEIANKIGFHYALFLFLYIACKNYFEK